MNAITRLNSAKRVDSNCDATLGRRERREEGRDDEEDGHGELGGSELAGNVTAWRGTEDGFTLTISSTTTT